MKSFIKELINRISKHDVKSYAAQSAYYLLLSLFPFIILLLIFLTPLGVTHSVELEKLLSALPKSIESMIKNYLSYSSELSATFISPILITAILMSSNAMVSLIKAFNKANNVEETRSFIKTRIIAIASLLLTLLLILLDLTFPTLSSSFINRVFHSLNLPSISSTAYDIYKFIISKIIDITFIGMLFYILPNKKRTIRGIIPGTLFSAIAIGLGSYLFIYIVNNFTKYSLVYGSLSSIIILMVWLYLCAYILILGEEINSILKNKKLIQGKEKI